MLSVSVCGWLACACRLSLLVCVCAVGRTIQCMLLCLRVGRWLVSFACACLSFLVIACVHSWTNEYMVALVSVCGWLACACGLGLLVFFVSIRTDQHQRDASHSHDCASGGMRMNLSCLFFFISLPLVSLPCGWVLLS